MAGNRTDAILAHCRSLAEGEPVTAEDFACHHGKHAAGLGLRVLCTRGLLVRVSRGLYVATVEGRFGRRPPSAARVAEALARRRGETLVPHGAMEANRLGVSTQVPMRVVMLTSGRTRTVRTGGADVEVRHAPAWLLWDPGGPAGTMLRALHDAGPDAVAGRAARLGRIVAAGTDYLPTAPPKATPAWLREAWDTVRVAS